LASFSDSLLLVVLASPYLPPLVGEVDDKQQQKKDYHAHTSLLLPFPLPNTSCQHLAVTRHVDTLMGYPLQDASLYSPCMINPQHSFLLQDTIQYNYRIIHSSYHPHPISSLLSRSRTQTPTHARIYLYIPIPIPIRWCSNSTLY